jgi:plasmid stabilization system protein ParE
VTRSVRYHPEAAEEVQGAVDWYRQRSAEAATGFIAELDYALEQVTALPETWPEYIENTRRYVFRVYPYSLVYRLIGDDIVVVAVAHAKRKPGYWSSRKE